jgi:sugar phosphate isomerase/epimerase
MIRSEAPKRILTSLADIAVGGLTLGNQDPFVVMESASAGGFGAVNLKFTPRPQEVPPRLMMDTGYRHEVGVELARRRLRLLSFGGFWLDGVTEISQYRPAIEAGSAMGVRFAIALCLDANAERRLSHLRQLAELCADYGVNVALEFFAYSAVRSIGEGCAHINALGMPNVKLLVDALHLSRSGGDASQLRSLDPSVFGYFQLCDAPTSAPPPDKLSFEALRNRLDPGEGELPLHEYLAALPDGAPIELEIPRLASAHLSAVDRSRELAAKVQQFISLRPSYDTTE